MMAAPYQGQLQQAQMENLVFNNELSTARSMMNQLNRLIPNAGGANMLTPNLGAANFAQNNPYAAPQQLPNAGTLTAPVTVSDDDISIIPEPVPSTSAGKYFSDKKNILIFKITWTSTVGVYARASPKVTCHETKFVHHFYIFLPILLLNTIYGILFFRCGLICYC